MRTLDGPPARVRLPHEPLEEDRPRPVLVAWQNDGPPVVFRPRLELAGPPEPVTYHVTYIHDPRRPETNGYYVVGSTGAHHGPMTERAAEQYRDYLEEFPRTDPRD